MMGWPADPVERKKRKQAEYLKHREIYLRRNAAHKKTPAGQISDKGWRLKKRYKISKEEWLALFTAQGGICAICITNPIKHTDHCHYTGTVRGLLCHKCNVGIGLFRDDPALLARAIAYLKRNKAPQPKLG